MPISLSAIDSPLASRPDSNAGQTIRIEILRSGGAVVVEEPAEQAHQSAVLLRGLLG